MKQSMFNVHFDYEGYNIAYNTFTDTYLIMDPDLFELYNACRLNNDFSDMEEFHNEFYQQIKDGEFFVADDENEVERVKKMSFEIDNDQSKFELHINPTMNCNFKCWYCYETHIKDSKMSAELIDSTIVFINNVLKKNKLLKSFHLSWFGGEPLLYFDKVVSPILKAADAVMQDRGIEFSSGMTTNGLLLTERVVDECEKNRLNFFQITLDGNRERHDKVRFISEGRGSYDQIVANIKRLVAKKIEVVVRFNISPETLEGIEDIAEDFKDVDESSRQYLKFSLHKVWQIGLDIEEEIFNKRVFFRKNGFKVVSGTQNTVVNSCYGDHANHAVINYNGDVFKCTARDFTADKREGLLLSGGEIDWSNKYDKRLNSKFKNKPCLKCPILPMCGGGCTQQAIENEDRDYCVYDFDYEKKLNIVKNRFIEILAENE